MVWIFTFLAGLLILVVFLTRRRGLPNEPPLDTGKIPWLGNAIEFGKDAAAFLNKMKRKHGDIFTVQVMGRYLTVLLDPHSYDSVVWESSSKLDFAKYARSLMDKIFNVQLPDYDPVEEKAMMKLHLQEKSLPVLTNKMLSNLKTILLSDINELSKMWKQDGLFHFSYDVMFRAGYLTLYGNESAQCNDPTSQAKDRAHSAEVYQQFNKFDQLLIKLARSMLSAAQRKEAASVKEYLWKLLSAEKLNSKTNRSSWLESYQRHLEELGVDADMQTRAMLLQLWATQGNAGPASFWLLLFLLKNPVAMAAIQEEAKWVFKNSGRRTNEVHTISQETLDNTPVFDSVLSETLRLTAAPFITREVLQDMSLKLADGREYHLRKGDRLCLFPYLSPQMDPDIYEEPEKFKYNRFLNPDGTEKQDFYKGGKQLKHYTMPWGAGINVCVGRFFAIKSIKLFVFLLLNHFDIELCDPEAEIPAFDVGRYGFGMLQPKHDIEIRYKLKA